MSDKWVCPRCGNNGNVGEYCDVCGTPISPTINKSPTPVSTPTPVDFSTSNPTPTPANSPVDYQSATTYRAENSDGSYSIIDKISGNELYTVYNDGSVKLLNNKYISKIGKLDISRISYDDNTATITIKDYDGKLPLYMIRNGEIQEEYIYTRHSFSDGRSFLSGRKYDMDGNLISYEEHEGGVTRVFLPDEKTLIKTIYEDGSYDIYEDNNIIRYDANNKLKKIVYEDGSYDLFEGNRIIKYGTDGSTSLYKDGKLVYTNINNLILYPEGTYQYEGERGTYTVDKNGNIICKNSEGQQTFFNKYGKEYQVIYPDGSSIFYDEQLDSKRVIKDGKTTYSRINHIEYDEESYNIILNTLNGFEGSNIDGECDKIVSVVNSFPDSCSTSGIENVKNDVKNHVNLIKSLSEMTNYSLLAYQTCDEELRDGLYLLVDSLFSENEKELGDRFKNAIKNTIEDRDNDKILEYKEGTNFRELANNEIIAFTYTDEDGNKLHFNNKGKIIAFDGNNIKLNYGGESFTLNFGKNGCAILRDSNGNPINIFGEYNLDSKQYGGDQRQFSNENNLYLLEDDRINAMLDSYFPSSTYEEKQAYLNCIGNTGCGFVCFSNLAFKRMEGYEEDFQNNFGYPMYDIVYKDGTISVDYNYEPLVLELYSEVYAKEPIIGHTYGYGDTFEEAVSIKEATSNGRGMNWQMYYIEKYLAEKYNIYDYNLDQNYTYCSVCFVGLENESGSESVLGRHAVALTETNNVDVYVSSWGEKYKVKIGNGSYDEVSFPFDYSSGRKYNDGYNGLLMGPYRFYMDEDGNRIFKYLEGGNDEIYDQLVPSE